MKITVIAEDRPPTTTLTVHVHIRGFIVEDPGYPGGFTTVVPHDLVVSGATIHVPRTQAIAMHRVPAYLTSVTPPLLNCSEMHPDVEEAIERVNWPIGSDPEVTVALQVPFSVLATAALGFDSTPDITGSGSTDPGLPNWWDSEPPKTFQTKFTAAGSATLVAVPVELPAERQKTAVVAVVDISGSMGGANNRATIGAIIECADDIAAVIAYNDNAVPVDPTAPGLIRQLQARGMTSFHAAFGATAQAVKEQINGGASHVVVVFMTDGHDTSSIRAGPLSTYFGPFLNMMTFHAVGVGTGHSVSVLQSMARQQPTGMYSFANDAATLTTILRSAIKEGQSFVSATLSGEFGRVNGEINEEDGEAVFYVDNITPSQLARDPTLTITVGGGEYPPPGPFEVNDGQSAEGTIAHLLELLDRLIGAMSAADAQGIWREMSAMISAASFEPWAMTQVREIERIAQAALRGRGNTSATATALADLSKLRKARVFQNPGRERRMGARASGGAAALNAATTEYQMVCGSRHPARCGQIKDQFACFGLSPEQALAAASGYLLGVVVVLDEPGGVANHTVDAPAEIRVQKALGVHTLSYFLQILPQWANEDQRLAFVPTVTPLILPDVRPLVPFLLGGLVAGDFHSRHPNYLFTVPSILAQLVRGGETETPVLDLLRVTVQTLAMDDARLRQIYDAFINDTDARGPDSANLNVILGAHMALVSEESVLPGDDERVMQLVTLERFRRRFVKMGNNLMNLLMAAVRRTCQIPDPPPLSSPPGEFFTIPPAPLFKVQAVDGVPAWAIAMILNGGTALPEDEFRAAAGASMVVLRPERFPQAYEMARATWESKVRAQWAEVFYEDVLPQKLKQALGKPEFKVLALSYLQAQGPGWNAAVLEIGFYPSPKALAGLKILTTELDRTAPLPIDIEEKIRLNHSQWGFKSKSDANEFLETTQARYRDKKDQNGKDLPYDGLNRHGHGLVNPYGECCCHGMVNGVYRRVCLSPLLYRLHGDEFRGAAVAKAIKQGLTNVSCGNCQYCEMLL